MMALSGLVSLLVVSDAVRLNEEFRDGIMLWRVEKTIVVIKTSLRPVCERFMETLEVKASLKELLNLDLPIWIRRELKVKFPSSLLEIVSIEPRSAELEFWVSFEFRKFQESFASSLMRTSTVASTFCG